MKYTQTKIYRLFETVVVKDKNGEVVGYKTQKRASPIPPQPREFKKVDGLEHPVSMSAGQLINLKKEKARQEKRYEYEIHR